MQIEEERGRLIRRGEKGEKVRERERKEEGAEEESGGGVEEVECSKSILS